MDHVSPCNKAVAHESCFRDHMDAIYLGLILSVDVEWLDIIERTEAILKFREHIRYFSVYT